MKFTITFILLLVALTGLIGCSEPADADQRLTIYTGRDKDEVAMVVRLFTEKHPKYKDRVDTVILGAQEALTRLRSEKANPQAGFLWGGTLQGLQQVSNEGLLAASTPLHAGLIDSSRKDPQGRWHAEMLLPEVIVYNHDLLKPEDAPKDWDDLITPKYKDKIVIRDVMKSGTMRTIYGAMIYRQAAGGPPDPGYDWLRKLDANTVLYTSTPEDMYIKLDRGVGVITLWNLQDALIQPRRNNRPWSFVMPESGAPVVLDGVAVVNNPSSMRAAQEFQDFLLEPQLQARLARDYYYIPAMEIPESEKPEWLTKLTIREMKVDWETLGRNENEWMEYWSQNIKGKGAK